MALISCVNCGKKVSDKAKVCPNCGEQIVFEEPVVEEMGTSQEVVDEVNEETIEEPFSIVICEECGIELPADVTSCSNCGCPVETATEEVVEKVVIENEEPVEEKKKTDKKILLGSIVIALIIVIACSIIFIAGKPGRVIKSAKKLVEEGNYVAAVEKLVKLNKPEKTETLLEEIYETMENEVYDLMDEGEYVKAQKKADKYNVLPTYKTMCEKIKYESFILTAMFDYRPNLKNPNSMQVNEIELYLSDDEDAKYPIIIARISGQNGFGGYSSNYSYYSENDLTYRASCETLNEYDYDSTNLDELLEKFICQNINNIREGEMLDVKFDLDRINKLLSDNVTPTLDIESYVEAQSA